MGEFNRAGVIHMIFLQMAVANGEITSEEAVDLYMDAHFGGAVGKDGESA
jgi:hypothetical protein